MPDTISSIYSEHDKTSEELESEFKKYEKRIQGLLTVLKSNNKGSKEYDIARLEIKKIANTRDPVIPYAYTDENGNDMFTTLGGGNYISELAIKELKKSGLEKILNREGSK